MKVTEIVFQQIPNIQYKLESIHPPKFKRQQIQLSIKHFGSKVFKPERTFSVTNVRATAHLIHQNVYGWSGSEGDVEEIIALLKQLED